MGDDEQAANDTATRAHMESLDEVVRRLVDEAPPLGPGQRARIGVIVTPSGRPRIR